MRGMGCALYIRCALSIHKKVKIRKKNEDARKTVQYFPVDNALVIYTKGLNS
jgi:hypothetical protein